MEREARYQEYRFSGETGRQAYRQQAGAKPEEKNGGKIHAILLELKDLEKLPVVALLVPIVPEKPEEPKERAKTLPGKILEWVIRCAKRVFNRSSSDRSAS